MPSRRWPSLHSPCTTQAPSSSSFREGPNLRAFFHCRVRCKRSDVAVDSLPDAPLGFNHQSNRASWRPDLDLGRSRPRRRVRVSEEAQAFRQTGGGFVPPVAALPPKRLDLDWWASTGLAKSKTVVCRPQPEWVHCCGAEAPQRCARWVPLTNPKVGLASPVDGLVSCAEAHLTSLPGWTLPPFRRMGLSSAGSASVRRSAQMHLPMGSASQSKRTRELCPAAGSAARPRGTAWLYPERFDRTPAEAGAVSLLGRFTSSLRRAPTLPCGFSSAPPKSRVASPVWARAGSISPLTFNRSRK